VQFTTTESTFENSKRFSQSGPSLKRQSQKEHNLTSIKTFPFQKDSRAPGAWLTLVRFEICIDESLVVAKYGSGHSRPWLGYAQSSIDIIFCYYLSLLKNQKVGHYSTKLKLAH